MPAVGQATRLGVSEFLSSILALLRPYSQLPVLDNAKQRSKTIIWNDASETAFKETLAEATLLSHPKPDTQKIALWS